MKKSQPRLRAGFAFLNKNKGGKNAEKKKKKNQRFVHD